MCGRFTLATPAEIIAEAFALTSAPALCPRYNIAPSQEVAIVRRGGRGDNELALVRWGLIPAWARDSAIGNRMINARSETLAEKPAFRAALRARRCVVVADGFYEWQRAAGRTQPFYFKLRDGGPFGFAGLWERWGPAGEEPVESCTIVTTEANELVRPIHERMPVIFAPEAVGSWLEPGTLSGEAFDNLLRAYPAAAMSAFSVGLRVNSPANDDPACIAPMR